MNKAIRLNCFQSTGLLVLGALSGVILGIAAFFAQVSVISTLPAYFSLPIYLGGGQMLGLTAVFLFLGGAFLNNHDC